MKNITISIILLFILGLLAQYSAISAQPKADTLKFFYGAYAGYNFNMHRAAFTKINEECSTCNPTNYDNGDGSGVGAGLLLEFPIFSNRVRTPMAIGARIGYEMLSADFSVEEVLGNTYTTAITKAYSNHILETTLNAISFNPYFSYNVSRIAITLGPKLNYLITATFNQREVLIKPEEATFLDTETKERNRYDNIDIANHNALQFGMNIGIGYEFPIGKYSTLAPEINYTLNFTDVSNVDWKINTLRFGLAAKFPYTKSELSPQKFYRQDTTIKEKFGISTPTIVLQDSTVNIQGIDTIVTLHYLLNTPKEARKMHDLSYYAMEENKKIKDTNITIEEFATTEGFPILPIIFFKEGSSDINTSKQHLLSVDGANSFNLSAIKPDAIAIYYDMLNIIGSKMKQNPKTTITIVGYATSDKPAQASPKITIDRVKSVGTYLSNVWGIDEKRIAKRFDGVANRTATVPNPDVVAENQKVEITTNDLELIYPIMLSNVSQSITPDKFVFTMQAFDEGGLKENNLSIKQDGKDLRSVNDVKNIVSYNNEFTWNIQEPPTPISGKPISVDYSIRTADGTSENITKTIPITIKTIESKRAEIVDDIEIEKYSLVLFDFNSSELKPVHKLVLNDIKKSIQPNSEILISGFADRTGDSDYNINLSNKRCIAVNNYINPNGKLNVKMDAVGNSRIIFNNNTPEGRSLSRTVRIEIKTPTK